MAGEGVRRRAVERRQAAKDATQAREVPITSARGALPAATRKRKRLTSCFEVNGQHFPSDFDAALYIVLESKHLTLRSFMEAAIQEQKRLAKQNWKLALLQDHSLRVNKYAACIQGGGELANGGVKTKELKDMSSDDPMSVDEVTTNSDPESPEAEPQSFLPTFGDCTSDEEDASPEAPKCRARSSGRTANKSKNHSATKLNSGSSSCAGRVEEDSATTMAESEQTALAKPEEHKTGGLCEDLFSADFEDRTHCEYCHERGDRKRHSTSDGDAIKVSYHCANEKCIRGFDKYIGWAVEPAAKAQTTPPGISAPAPRKAQASSSTSHDLSQLHSNFSLTGAALLVTMQKIKPDAENNTICPFCAQPGTEMIKDHAVIYLCLNRNCHKLSKSTHVQKIVGWRATKPNNNSPQS